MSNSAAHAISSTGDDAQPSKKRKKKMKHNYNFCKSNSLGILAVAEAHHYLGPAMLHWEGGWAGERKIQQAKPLLSIKRATADWRRIVLENLWRENTLSGLIERMNGDKQALKDQINKSCLSTSCGPHRYVRINAPLLAQIRANRPTSAKIGPDRPRSSEISTRLLSLVRPTID